MRRRRPRGRGRRVAGRAGARATPPRPEAGVAEELAAGQEQLDRVRGADSWHPCGRDRSVPRSRVSSRFRISVGDHASRPRARAGSSAGLRLRLADREQPASRPPGRPAIPRELLVELPLERRPSPRRRARGPATSAERERDALVGRRRRPRVSIRSASARAASTCCASFISCRAWSGVLLRSRRVQNCSRFGRVEVRHERRRRGPLPERVQAAAVERRRRGPAGSTACSAGVADRLPDVRRLVRLHAAAAHRRG